ncbi:hypothetical protein [Sorangium sp. So ce1335]|uniref:hypothetical protein n=1 Tax=Sorangium sp. So ce1335 TaxID=3133335 RepID=UPI003F5E1C21
MRPTQKMKRAAALPARNDKQPERPAPKEPGAPVKAAREALEKKRELIRELAGGAKLDETLGRGRELIQEISARAREGRKVVPARLGAGPAAPAEPAREGGEAEGPQEERVARIEAAEKRALEDWRALEDKAREMLALRARRLEARQRALARYQAARERGLGAPSGRLQGPGEG